MLHSCLFSFGWPALHSQTLDKQTQDTEELLPGTSGEPFVVGLTGGIASGKTVVSDMLAAVGVAIVDADVIARWVVEPGSRGLAQLSAHYGNTILDTHGRLDRGRLRQIIFGDANERAVVESILHPLIRERASSEIRAAARAGAPYVVHVVPLLVETAQIEAVDRVLVLIVPAELQLARLMRRDNCSREAAERIVAAQASDEQRLAYADDVLDTSVGEAELHAAVMRLHASYLGQARLRQNQATGR